MGGVGNGVLEAVPGWDLTKKAGLHVRWDNVGLGNVGPDNVGLGNVGLDNGGLDNV